MDRITGMAAMMLLALFVLTSPSYQYNIPIILLIYPVFVLVSLIILCLVSVFLGNHLEKFLISKCQGLKGRILRYVGSVSLSLNQLRRQKRQIFSSLLLSVIFQFLSTGTIAIFARTIAPSLSLFDWFWVNAIVSIVTLLPFSVGGLGIREGVFATVLSLFGIPPENAVALALSIYTIQIAGAVCGAGLYMFEINSLSKGIEYSN
jgi:uncharacterized membrane protein YbhN (UPF0104 family)